MNDASMKLLVIDDDKQTASFLESGFREAGFVVDSANDGMQGLDLALIHNYDAAVIDVMLPSLDGLSIIERMRAEGVQTPVIVLSAKRTVNDRIEGIKKGGDDYMVKPFSFSELLVRVQALLRRASGGGSTSRAESGTLKFDELELDPWKREVRRKGKSISLQSREFALLEYMMRNPGRVVSKACILDNIYDYSFNPQTNVVDVLVCRLRNKVDKGFDRQLIHTMRGMGYILKSA